MFSKGGFMILWEFLVICGIGFIILELFTPSMFFLNFALASFLTAVVSLYTTRTLSLVIIFFVLSFLSFVFLRPLLLKRNSKETETGINDKYIGKTAKVVEDISQNSGTISIYDERWNARCSEGVINAGETVKIISNDSLIMYVEKCE